VRVRTPAAAFLASSLLLCACGGDDEAAPTSPPPPAATATATETTATPPPAPGTTTEIPAPLPGLPKSVAGYKGWMKLNDAPLPPRDSDPHLSTKNVYASEEARANGRFPNGTVIVKEGMAPGKDFITLIAIMRKERGADPAHNDWLFVEYARVRRDQRFSELASGAVCYGCHVGAESTDYVWIKKLGLAK
jgi:Cytochrome P460